METHYLLASQVLQQPHKSEMYPAQSIQSPFQSFNAREAVQLNYMYGQNNSVISVISACKQFKKCKQLGSVLPSSLMAFLFVNALQVKGHQRWSFRTCQLQPTFYCHPNISDTFFYRLCHFIRTQIFQIYLQGTKYTFLISLFMIQLIINLKKGRDELIDICPLSTAQIFTIKYL